MTFKKTNFLFALLVFDCMDARINMVGIITNDFEGMRAFYKNVLGFKVKLQMDKFVEFENEGVRFAISTNEIMKQATGQESYGEKKHGHSFELAFEADSPEDVDVVFEDLVKKGATPIKRPADMPWGQRTAFFSDPDGNIHEIFSNLKKS